MIAGGVGRAAHPAAALRGSISQAADRYGGGGFGDESGGDRLIQPALVSNPISVFPCWGWSLRATTLNGISLGHRSLHGGVCAAAAIG